MVQSVVLDSNQSTTMEKAKKLELGLQKGNTVKEKAKIITQA
jgi:hypothetical protein